MLIIHGANFLCFKIFDIMRQAGNGYHDHQTSTPFHSSPCVFVSHITRAREWCMKVTLVFLGLALARLLTKKEAMQSGILFRGTETSLQEEKLLL